MYVENSSCNLQNLCTMIFENKNNFNLMNVKNYTRKQYLKPFSVLIGIQMEAVFRPPTLIKYTTKIKYNIGETIIRNLELAR